MIRAATCPAPPLATISADLPENLSRLVDKALAFSREDRWPSAEAMRDAVNEVYRTPEAARPRLPSVLRSVASKIQISFPPEGAGDGCAPTALAPIVSPPRVSAQVSEGAPPRACDRSRLGSSARPAPTSSFAGWGSGVAIRRRRLPLPRRRRRRRARREAQSAGSAPSLLLRSAKRPRRHPRHPSPDDVGERRLAPPLALPIDPCLHPRVRTRARPPRPSRARAPPRTRRATPPTTTSTANDQSPPCARRPVCLIRRRFLKWRSPPPFFPRLLLPTTRPVATELFNAGRDLMRQGDSRCRLSKARRERAPRADGRRARQACPLRGARTALRQRPGQVGAGAQPRGRPPATRAKPRRLREFARVDAKCPQAPLSHAIGSLPAGVALFASTTFSSTRPRWACCSPLEPGQHVDRSERPWQEAVVRECRFEGGELDGTTTFLEVRVLEDAPASPRPALVPIAPPPAAVHEKTPAPAIYRGPHGSPPWRTVSHRRRRRRGRRPWASELCARDRSDGAEGGRRVRGHDLPQRHERAAVGGGSGEREPSHGGLRRRRGPRRRRDRIVARRAAPRRRAVATYRAPAALRRRRRRGRVLTIGTPADRTPAFSPFESISPALRARARRECTVRGRPA